MLRTNNAEQKSYSTEHDMVLSALKLFKYNIVLHWRKKSVRFTRVLRVYNEDLMVI